MKKKTVKKITLSRETLHDLEARRLDEVVGGATYACPPASYGTSCISNCPVKMSDNCA